MPQPIQQSLARRVLLKAYLRDGVTAATGKTLAVVISKNGAAFGNPSAGATNATEIASGWYYADLSTTDFGTAGPMVVRGTATGVDDVELVFDVGSAVTGTYQIKKNTALSNFEFPMYDSTNHAPATGLTVTGTVSLDGAAFTSLTNAVAEVASGVYKVNLAAADSNANVFTLKFTATAADTLFITIITQV